MGRRKQEVESWVRARLVIWGNWHIRRSGHEHGWPSVCAVLNEWGAVSFSHRILYDQPERVRQVEHVIAQLHHVMQKALVLRYCWDRDTDGNVINDHQRAVALEFSTSQYRDLVRVGRLLVQKLLTVNAK